MSEWRKTTLGELLTVKHGYAFKGKHFAAEGDEIVLTPGNFPVGGGLRFRAGKERFYSGWYPPEYRLSPGQLVLVMTDLKQDAPILGSPAFVPSHPPVLHNQRLGLVTIKPDQDVDARFLYYLLLSDTTRQHLRATATGSTVRHTAPERIYRVPIDLPPRRIQHLIGATLGSLDDLIENNLRRIELLEQMARTIYREWFVLFRYPGHEDATLVDSPLGPLPEGWEVKPLIALASLTMGQSPRSEHYNTEGIGVPFHQGVTDYGRHFPTSRKYCSVDGRRALDGDVLISVRAPVGRLNIAAHDLVIGRGLAAARSRTGRQALLFRALTDVAFAEEDSMGGGTIYKAIGKKELEQVQMVCAPPRLEVEAEALLTDNLALIRALTFENRALVSSRDLLLPKLVTGKIEISSLDLDAVAE